MALTVTGCSSSAGLDRIGSSPPSSPPAGVSASEAALIAPLAPARLTVTLELGTVHLSWPSTGEDVASFRCLRREVTSTRWDQVDIVTPERAANTYECALRETGLRGTYVYGVQASNEYGTSSPITEGPPLTFG